MSPERVPHSGTTRGNIKLLAGIEQGKGSRLRSASDGQAGKQLVPSKSREEFSRGGKAPKARVKTAGF
ncbi:MAG: hypothetical protein A2122_02630 [Candidatus Liptonbacteria bacterium GWB1_49_6]|uniref:Uncharacterized protein n=1 Tax=Candidatus Liptonbacteria bacterium GWB1_49_6 TaxID=1798644 RepID=A0A1G2C730_9BACT|nr:MAG: hypothetical protein A2122_02630 [Candidatus Liptonbacteria bacterium GWB1_49_6]